jgi:hypothetical protein
MGNAASLLAEIIKLVLNSMYGRCCMAAYNFFRYSIMTENHLIHTGVVDDPTVVLISLLGFVPGVGGETTMDSEPLETAAKTPRARLPAWRKKLRQATPQMLFAVTRRNDDARVNNVSQMSASILSQSRRVFLSHVANLLGILDRRVSEQCYQDTYDKWQQQQEDNPPSFDRLCRAGTRSLWPRRTRGSKTAC